MRGFEERKIDFRREFPSGEIERRTARLGAILAAYQAEIGDENMPVALLIDAANTAGRLAQELFMTAERWGVPVAEVPSLP